MAESHSLTPPRRRWLRYSLRTLLLFVLLIGSAATMWWNWGPWAPDFTINTRYPLFTYDYSPKDTYIWTTERGPDSGDPLKVGIVTFYDPHTGAQLLRKERIGSSTCDVGFSPAEKYFIVRNGSENPFEGPFESATGALLPLKGYQLEESDIRIDFSTNDSYAFYTADSQVWHLVHLPDLKEIPTKLTLTEHFLFWQHFTFSCDEKSLLLAPEEKRVLLIDTASGAQQHDWGFDGKVSGVAFSPDDRFIAVSVDYEKPWHYFTYLYDRQSGLPVGRATGALRTFSRDGTRIIASANGPDERKIFISDLANPEKPSIIFDEPAIVMPDKWSYHSRSYVSTDVIVDDRQLRVCDANSGAELWKSDEQGYVTRNSDFIATYIYTTKFPSDEHTIALHEIRTGRVVMDFTTVRWFRAFPQGISGLSMAHTSSDFLTEAADQYDSERYRIDKTCVSHWKQRRPLAWYGPAYLPEFWLALVLGAGFLRSLRRDRKILNAEIMKP